MICPYCGYDNATGISLCDGCTQDLTAFDEPAGASLVETSIMEMPLVHFRSRTPVFVRPNATVAEAVSALCNYRIGCVLIGAGDAIEGIFSERDVLLRVADRFDELGARPVSEFMTRDPEVLEVGSPIAFALNRMALGDFRHLPLTADGHVVGVISLRDVLSFLSEWYPDLIPAETA